MRLPSLRFGSFMPLYLPFSHARSFLSAVKLPNALLLGAGGLESTSDLRFRNSENQPQTTETHKKPQTLTLLTWA
jgi:hypothetical protein